MAETLDQITKRHREEMDAALSEQRAALDAERAAALEEIRTLRAALHNELQAALDDLAREDQGRQSYTSRLTYSLPADLTSLLEAARANARQGTVAVGVFAVRGSTNHPGAFKRRIAVVDLADLNGGR